MQNTYMNTLQRLSDENLLEVENATENGRLAIGFYCLYSPIEIAVAVDAITLPLCGKRNDPINAAEEILPRNLCPLIKSSFGFAKTDTCPFFRSSDLIVGDTTCDGKKKMFELLAQYKTTHVLQLPQNQNEQARTVWRQEVERLKEIVEEQSGITITDDRLHAAIRLMNRKRMAKKAIMDLNKQIPAPLSGSLMLEILEKTGSLVDKEKGIRLMEEVLEEVGKGTFERRNDNGENRKRILLTGVPVGIGSDKVVKLVEQSSADVIAFENCSGYKGAFVIDENKDPMDALTEHYLSTPCSVMSPNSGRLQLLAEMIRDFAIDGVIDLTWQACHTYNIEAYSVDEFIQENFDLPTLHLETDYSVSDTEQLRVRIEAFVEILS